MLRLVTIGLLLVALLSLAACGDDDGDNGSMTSATATSETSAGGDPTATTNSDAPSTSGDEDTTVVESAADQVMDAIQTKDRNRLRDATGDQDQQRLRDQDFDRLMQCVPEGGTIEVVDREVTINGDTATVVQTLEVTVPGSEPTTVEHTFTFERMEDGDWFLAELPECPFQQ